MKKKWVIFKENTVTTVRCYSKLEIKSTNAFIFLAIP